MPANRNTVSFILHPTSAGINESSCGFHQLQLPLPNQFVRLWSQVYRQQHKIGLLEQIIYLLTVNSSNGTFFFLVSEGKNPEFNSGSKQQEKVQITIREKVS